jgi:hypothetical protein
MPSNYYGSSSHWWLSCKMDYNALWLKSKIFNIIKTIFYFSSVIIEHLVKSEISLNFLKMETFVFIKFDIFFSFGYFYLFIFCFKIYIMENKIKSKMWGHYLHLIKHMGKSIKLKLSNLWLLLHMGPYFGMSSLLCFTLHIKHNLTHNIEKRFDCLTTPICVLVHSVFH